MIEIAEEGTDQLLIEIIIPSRAADDRSHRPEGPEEQKEERQ